MNTKEQGLSLVELLVASAILLIAIIPLMRVLMFGLETGNRANKLTIATNLARDMSEEIRTQAFSEEFARVKPEYSLDNVYPNKDDKPQHVGKDPGEEESKTLTDGGRVRVFDDVDDYDGWCRGDCNDTPGDTSDDTYLETFDGYQYSGSQGYPPYLGFTRKVRVFNLDVAERHISEFQKDPFANYTGTTNKNFIKRYIFENATSIKITSQFRVGTSDEIIVTSTDAPLNVKKDKTSVEGLSPIKRIEVTVTYNGSGTKGVKVTDVSYAVMPLL